jgi:hypothetical protein
MQTFNYFNDIPKPKIIKITPKSHPEIWEKLQPKANRKK